MSNEKNEARDAAFDQYMRGCNHDDARDPNYSPMSCCDVCRGRRPFLETPFHAGYAAALTASTDWTPIAGVEDLPKEAGEYLVTMHTPSTEKHVTTRLFYLSWNAGTDMEKRLQTLRREYWLPSKHGTQYITAWAHLPEGYTADTRPLGDVGEVEE